MSNTRIQLSDHFTYPRLLRFVAPSITMMIFTSITAWWTGSSSQITSAKRRSRR